MRILPREPKEMDKEDFGQNTFSRGPFVADKLQNDFGFTFRVLGDKWDFSDQTASELIRWIYLRMEAESPVVEDPSYSGITYLFEHKNRIEQKCPHCGDVNVNFGCWKCGERYEIPTPPREDELFWKFKREATAAEKVMKIAQSEDFSDMGLLKKEFKSAIEEYLKVKDENKKKDSGPLR